MTALDDPVSSVEWSPSGDWLAISVAPGGGMNGQIYLARPDGTGLKRYTPGGKDNNWLAPWTHDGSALMMSSNVRDGAAMDCYLLAVPDGKMEMVAQNPGIGNFEDISRDNRLALLSRMKSRGSNDIYLVDLSSKKEVNLTPHDGPVSHAILPVGPSLTASQSFILLGIAPGRSRCCGVPDACCSGVMCA